MPTMTWVDEDGMHLMITAVMPPAAMSPEGMPDADQFDQFDQFDLSDMPDPFEDMTREYQKQIQDSPIWDMMVAEFGEPKAEEMLQEFQALPG